MLEHYAVEWRECHLSLLRRQHKTPTAFDRFAYPDRTWLKSGSIELTLRKNPQARRNSWAAEPGRTHFKRR